MKKFPPFIDHVDECEAHTCTSIEAEDISTTMNL